MIRNGLTSCLAAFFGALLVTPFLTRVGWKIGALDVPTDGRRMHRYPVPRIGGLAVFACVLLTLVLFGNLASMRLPVILGASAMFLTGLADDLFNLDAWIKLACQILCATVAVTAEEPLSWYAKFAAILWIVTLANAHNLIDGLDGLLAGTVVIEGAALGAALSLSENGNTLLPLLLAAAFLGFRIYNRAPATIFAGDCGSETAGFLLGVCSLPLLFRPVWGVGWLSAPMIFAYPLTDLTAAVARRILRGKPLFGADRAHLHHRLCVTGIRQADCARLLHLLCAGVATVGVLLTVKHLSFFASVACIVSVVFLLSVKQYVQRHALP